MGELYKYAIYRNYLENGVWEKTIRLKEIERYEL